MAGHPKFIGLTLTPSGGMLGAWEDGSVARWEPVYTYYVRGEERKEGGYWYAIPSPDYEALFCTTTKTREALDADALRREGAREALTHYSHAIVSASRAIDVRCFRDREYPATPSGEGEEWPCIRCAARKTETCPDCATPPNKPLVIPVCVQAKGRTAHEIEDAFITITPALARRIVAMGQERTQ